MTDATRYFHNQLAAIEQQGPMSPKVYKVLSLVKTQGYLANMNPSTERDADKLIEKIINIRNQLKEIVND